MNQKITNYVIHKSDIPVFKEGAYSVTMPKKYRKIGLWLRKIIVNILLKTKLIKQYYSSETTYERVEINRDEVIDLIRDLFDDIYYNSGKKPRTVIIGFDNMKKLDCEIYQEMRFSIPLELNGSNGRKIFGLDIILNPRIDGLVLV